MHNPFNHLINIFHFENLWVFSLVFSYEILLFEIIQSHIFTDILICENFTPLCGGLQKNGISSLHVSIHAIVNRTFRQTIKFDRVCNLKDVT